MLVRAPFYLWQGEPGSVPGTTERKRTAYADIAPVQVGLAAQSSVGAVLKSATRFRMCLEGIVSISQGLSVCLRLRCCTVYSPRLLCLSACMWQCHLHSAVLVHSWLSLSVHQVAGRQAERSRLVRLAGMVARSASCYTRDGLAGWLAPC